MEFFHHYYKLRSLLLVDLTRKWSCTIFGTHSFVAVTVTFLYCAQAHLIYHQCVAKAEISSTELFRQYDWTHSMGIKQVRKQLTH